MRKTTTILLLIVSILTMTVSAQKKQVSFTKEIPYQTVFNYFVKNTFKKEHFENPKITTQKEFDDIFGAAAFMGKNGRPTVINFAKQYVIAVTIKETSFITSITPVSLKKTNKRIVFTAHISSGKETSSIMKPLLLIAVDKKHTGKVEIQITQTTVEGEQTLSGLPLSSQWILKSFNGDSKLVTKNTYITLNKDLSAFIGNGGCNIINGSLKVLGNKIEFKKMISTKMFCEVMDQENKFTALLTIANTYKIIGGQLFLYQDDKLLMSLESYR